MRSDSRAMVEIALVGGLAIPLELNPPEDDAGGVGAGRDRGRLAREPLSRLVLSQVVEPPGFGQRVCRHDRPGDRQQQDGYDIRAHGGMVAQPRASPNPIIFSHLIASAEVLVL